MAIEWARVSWFGLGITLGAGAVGCQAGSPSSIDGGCPAGVRAADCDDPDGTATEPSGSSEPTLLNDAGLPLDGAGEGPRTDSGDLASGDLASGDAGDGTGEDAGPTPPPPDAFEEPALPPPLSSYYAEQQERLRLRRAACGLGPPVPLPGGLDEHLTTLFEYEAHQACVASIAAAGCTSSLVQAGDLSVASRCLYAEPTTYNAVEPPATCPFALESYTFDPRRERFSLHNAYWLLWMASACNLAEPAEIRAAFAARGFPDVRVVQAERLTVAIAEREDHVVFVFKGTTAPADYLSNASYAMKPSDETGLSGRVHSGFYGTLASGFAALEPELLAARDAGKKVFFAGHSLGGAVAQLAALKAATLGVEVAQLYAFSSPRVGDEAFAAAVEQLLGARLHRINNGLDITPHVPPSSAAEDPAREAILEIVGNADDPGFWLTTLSVTLQAGLLLADYTHAGDAYAFDERGYLQALHPYRDTDEIHYWEQLPSVIGEDDLIDVTTGFGQLPAYHNDQTHLCYQARAISQLLYPRD